MPCSIRDHYAYFRQHILPDHAKGENQEAEEALKDREYYRRLIEYDEQLRKLTEKIWKEEYMEEEFESTNNK